MEDVLNSKEYNEYVNIHKTSDPYNIKYCVSFWIKEKHEWLKRMETYFAKDFISGNLVYDRWKKDYESHTVEYDEQFYE